ncbi:Ger(x)C family spore germination protein [Alicyclobacillus sendaiensis]|uniref:Ger(X)C family spore germination protein n=1 Tax=Alicyclobacillus sendaiensis PA2 TaxID=3029425 RepID=A0ABT6XYZ7_ALISE|nr:Ger(x)C family spore germination protein [Alicyclobacillus sendaiensis]MDI9260027.1 Ger(x)C family spore germination protein [Alicyclobacillus sendaiensis PA2]
MRLAFRWPRAASRWLTLGLALFAPWATTGCYDRQELEQQAFVSVLGIDKAPGGLIDCTFRIAQPVNPTGASSRSGAQPLAGKEPVTVRARSIPEAMMIANGSVERSITFSHLSLIVFGEDLAKEGVEPYIEALTRYREFRRTVPVSVSKGKASESMKAFQPMLDSAITRIADGVALVSQRTGIAPVCPIQYLIDGMENPHEDAIAPIFAVNQNVQKGEMPDTPGLSYRAGEVRREGGNPVDWMGAAVFHEDRMVDEVTGTDCLYLRLLQGGVHHATLTLQDPEDPSRDIGLELHKERPAEYQVKLSNPMIITAHVPVDVDVINISSTRNYADPAARQKLEAELDKQVSERMERLLKRLLVVDQADVIPVSKAIRSQFMTYQQFAAFPWEEKLKTAKIRVEVQIHVRRFGVQLEPIEKKSESRPSSLRPR